MSFVANPFLQLLVLLENVDMKYYNSKENVAEYIKMAEGHSGKDLIAILKNYTKKGSSVLELGFGPGTDWKILSNDFNVSGSDYSAEFIKHLQNKYPSGNFLHLNAISLEIIEKFDAIYSNKVLHHLTNKELKESIENQARALSSDGIICHSFWQGEGEETFKGMYVNYHTQEALESLLSKKFKVLHTEQYQEFDTDDSIFIIAQKR